MMAASITAGKAKTMSQILIVAASSAPSWSLLSRLWGSLTIVQWAAVVAAAILTIGAVIEYWAKIKLLTLLAAKYLLGRSTSFDRCVFWRIFIHSIGPILVVLGIAGEVVFEGRAFILEDRQEEQNRKIVDSLSNKAATASTKADAASDKSDAVSNKTDALTTRLGVASKELIDIEYQTLLLGPRDKLLVGKRREKLVNAIKPFSGQKVDVQPIALMASMNGLSTGVSPTADEMSGLAKSLIGVFNEARWNAPAVLSNARSGLLGHGVSVHIFPDASSDTRRAAEGLVKALGDVPLAVSGPTSDIDPTKQPEQLDENAILVVVHTKEMPSSKASAMH